MIIYIFWSEDSTSGVEAFPSLRKAKSARATMFDKNDRPEILKVTLRDRLTKADACNLLMQKKYAMEMEDVA